ncbi:hypothetical protein POL68_25190 [Stigmatella sp. ncwal1]|uniref:Cytochrome c domain-containing protein n=1 Tax=Stigmatella ashevillensis TaxID=2995309 RepID=A0ABT5DFD2_9BACT|nr:hypothetical protein [Stigmatella ashevillena]MDC0711789.1 hypothetical protein [Stigmatella ashevillena]
MEMTRNRPVPGLTFGVSLLVLALAAGCSSSEGPPASQDGGPPDTGAPDAGDGGTGPTPATCLPANSNERIPLRHAATREPVFETFGNLRARVDTQCGTCHKAPEIRGGFQYTSSHAGLRDAAASMARMATQGAMPPLPTPDQLKQAVALGQALSSWLAQGAPEGSFEVREEGSSDGGVAVARDVGEAMTDLGHCIPGSEPLGRDPQKDAWFAQLTALPRLLSETDTGIVTFDARTLAQHGTVAFTPTYPLFSDHAKKLRQVHVPAGSAIRYEPSTQRFEIPPNTRFYKTFFKPVKDAQGRVGYRKIETRLIVVRQPWQDSLFGTYLWNEDETVAELHDLRYRDSSSFSDRVLVYRTDEATGTTRNYAIPGRHRCIDCHTGSEGRNFVLGFTPLQLNRRPAGEGGVDATASVLPDELSQVDRMIQYGILTGIRSSADLPKLETYGSKRPRNLQELEMQGYFIGNCAQCHNPEGFAVQSNPAIASLDFSAGGILYQFPPSLKESNGLRPYVHLGVTDFAADLRSPAPASTLFQRVARDTDERIIHMPANVPGQDCRAALLVARWIASLDWPRDNGLSQEQKEAQRQERLRQAELAVRDTCQDPPDVRWVSEDFTDKVPYEPRNPHWASRIGTPPFDHLTRYPITQEHEALARQRIPTNFWIPKPGCRFESNAPPPPSIEPWMKDALGNPKQPWGELYYATPGAVVFQGICANCHGRAGDGQSGAAKTLVALNGSRVANLVKGLGGTSSTGEPHVAMFERVLGPLGGARYLAWMASGGTTVTFTPEFMQAWIKYGDVDIDFSPRETDWGKWGANMLGAARGACDLVRAGKFGTGSSEPPSGNPNALGGATLWKRVCTLDNPLTPDIEAGTDDAAVAEWLQRAQFNAGVMAYFYLRDELSQGRIALLRSECTKR